LELNNMQDNVNTSPQALRIDGMDSNFTTQKDLSTLLLEEKQTKIFDYDQERYKAYLELVKQNGRWYGLGEKKLVALFPCFSLLLKEYDEKILAKRSKWERDLMKENKVEWRSLTETKGRVVTSAGQFFLLLQQIKPKDKKNDVVDITELFDTSKIKIYIQFLEELNKEASTIRNLLLTLKFIIKAFLGSTAFQMYQQQMVQACAWLDKQCRFQKAQDFNKQRDNEEDLHQQGHFMEEEEFSLLVIYLLKRIHALSQVNNKSVMQVFEYYATIALLDGGLRREVICRLHTDSLIVKNNGTEFYLKKQTEKVNRGNSHELPILEVSAYLFMMWKRERDALLKDDTTKIVSLWIDGKGQPTTPGMLVKKLKRLLKEFNPCLQMHKLDLRRLRISSLFEKREGDSTTTTSVEWMDSQLNIVADYLNTSLHCIQNNYNRHKTQLNKALNVLRPITNEMKEMFSEVKQVSKPLVRNTLKQPTTKVFDRYVRKTLDNEQHLSEYGQWQKEFEEFRNKNPSYPSFDELYGNLSKKRKRPNGSLQYEVEVGENRMGFEEEEDVENEK